MLVETSQGLRASNQTVMVGFLGKLIHIEYGVQTPCPERGLLVAILDRALRDLQPRAEKESRREAIAWFHSKVETSEGSFTYLQCMEELCLGYTECCFIAKKVLDAEKYEMLRLKTKDKKNGICVSRH